MKDENLIYCAILDYGREKIFYADLDADSLDARVEAQTCYLNPLNTTRFTNSIRNFKKEMTEGGLTLFLGESDLEKILEGVAFGDLAKAGDFDEEDVAKWLEEKEWYVKPDKDAAIEELGQDIVIATIDDASVNQLYATDAHDMFIEKGNKLGWAKVLEALENL